MIDAVLFDLDGTLIDSDDEHAAAWVAAAAEFDIIVTFAEVRRLIGMGADQLLPELRSDLSGDTEPGASMARRQGEIVSASSLRSIAPQPGARDLLAELRARGARIIIATSGSKAMLQRLLAIGDFAPLVDDATTSNDASTSKPAPDIVLAALEKAGVSADRALFVGDTEWDIAAAHRAGVTCIALRCGGMAPLSLGDADAVYDDPRALTAALDEYAFPLSSDHVGGSVRKIGQPISVRQ